MLKVTATPTWQWQSTPHKTSSTRNVSIRPTLPDIKRAVLPRSLDVSFAFSYRR